MDKPNIRSLAESLALLPFLTILILPANAQVVSTVAGGFVGDGRKATRASFQAPQDIVMDAHHNAYISDIYTHRIRKIAPDGTISTFAGTGIAGFSGDGGPAGAAMINIPTGMTMDGAGDIVFADSGNSRVRKIDTKGRISTIAGNGVYGNGGDGGPARLASMARPWGVRYDSVGNLYISDTATSSVRKVDTQGMISLFAGNYTSGFSGDGGLATQAELNQPTGLAFDGAGNLDISDRENRRVRQVSVGNINTIAGNGKAGFSGDGGLAINAAINLPESLAYFEGVLCIGGNAGKDRVRMVLGDGTIQTFLGSNPGYDGDHHPPLSSEFSNPEGMLMLSASKVVISDRADARVRALTGGLVKTVAGGFIGDGNKATAGALVLPHNVAFDALGNLYIADPGGNRIRKVDVRGKISTVAGTGISGYTGDNGPATSAELNFPFGVALDGGGNILIADNHNRAIRKVDATGMITTFAVNSNFFELEGMALDAAGNLFAADGSSCVIWELSPTGATSVAAGMLNSCGYNGDGVPATIAQLSDPAGVAVDATGNIYIADGGNNRIRMVDQAGTISTLTGDGTCSCSGDGGPPELAEICSPEGVAVDNGIVYIADEDNHRIRKIADGIITTYAGTGNAGYNGNNLPALNTNFDDPVGVAVDSKGLPYEVDYFEGLVRRVH